ncbi:hypothetical protein [Chromobacterium violaceum]|uniref:hypothetical protein n=1 Tax=Chromobacterium violaceum TaxID=536 RepID=UPI0015FD7AA6|nr:hypothetical protein [Chromobacterium violaceum]MBA8735340.1 hypothetical protein [Chromobacterium violaceum]
MADGLQGAVIGATGALVAGFFANFMAEDYRRFREAKALSGAIYGELTSITSGLDELSESIDKVISALELGGSIKLPEIQFPKNDIYEEYMGRLGLLDSSVVENIVYVYSQINSFRASYSLLCKPKLSGAMKIKYLKAARNSLNRASARKEILYEKLQAICCSRYCPFGVCAHVYEWLRKLY